MFVKKRENKSQMIPFQTPAGHTLLPGYPEKLWTVSGLEKGIRPLLC